MTFTCVVVSLVYSSLVFSATILLLKCRYKPFFQKHKPQDQLLDVNYLRYQQLLGHVLCANTIDQLHVHDHRLTVGELTLDVVKCSRLPHFDGARMVYCTVGVGKCSMHFNFRPQFASSGD